MLNVEIEQKENSSNHLSLKAIETNVNHFFFVMRYSESDLNRKRSSECCAIDSLRYCRHHSEFSENQRTISDLTSSINNHICKRKNQAMNCCCVKWLCVCKKTWIRELQKPTQKILFAKMIHRQCCTDRFNHQKRFI